MFLVVQAGGGDEMGILHADLPRPGVHHVPKGLLASGQIQGGGVGRVVAGGQKHPRRQV